MVLQSPKLNTAIVIPLIIITLITNLGFKQINALFSYNFTIEVPDNAEDVFRILISLLYYIFIIEFSLNKAFVESFVCSSFRLVIPLDSTQIATYLKIIVGSNSILTNISLFYLFFHNLMIQLSRKHITIFSR